MRVTTLVLCALLTSEPAATQAAVVIDRIAAIIGNRVIKTSDIDLDLRITDFLNQQPFAQTPEARRQAADRLIDQQIIRTELGTGGYARPAEVDVQGFLKQIRQSRFGGSDVRMRSALEKYGLTERQLEAQLLWQLTVLRFIDQRFRPGVLVTDEEVRAYYDLHHSELGRQNPKSNTFEALAPQIRESLEGERINKDFEAWLDGARKRNRVEYREEGLK